mmetsp:Transcript_26599/g.51539  ORF Transcript_26599/g.51539 Transcript_26599/m.51539 type:complete len:158 (-) Transcript_26599:132-605(-)
MRTVSSLLLRDSKKGIWLIHVHHVISIACYGTGLYLGRMHFFGVLDGVCEFSVIFLNAKLLWRDLKWRQNSFYILNAYGLVISWFITRILVFPAWIFLFCQDIYNQPQRTKDTVTLFELIMYPGTTIAIWAMSIKWFFPLVFEAYQLSVGKGATKES